MLTDQDYERAAKHLSCPVRRVKAVKTVESRGQGFQTDGQPIILFERHWFHKLTDGRFDNEPDLSNPKAGGYTNNEHVRLARASALDRNAALQSASWGLFQIMGFNHKACGFELLQDFINAMYKDEAAHLDAFVEFILFNRPLFNAIRQGDAKGFARAYNGPNYAQNKYDSKLIAAGF